MPVARNWQEAVYYIVAAIIFLVYTSLCIRASDKVPNTLADSVIAISFIPSAYSFLKVWQVIFVRFLGPRPVLGAFYFSSCYCP